MSPAIERYVRRLQSRSDLTVDEIEAVARLPAIERRKTARWDIVRPGERSDHACLVFEGLVGRAESFADGSRSTTAIYVPGDMADLHSVAVPVARWIITALTDCTYFEIPHDAIIALAEAQPRIGMALWRDTIADASIMSKWISVLSSQTTRVALAHLLCELSVRLKAAGLSDGREIELPLTQTQIADLLGVHEVHIGRTFRTLADEAIVSVSRRHIVILDAKALARLAKFDPDYLLIERTNLTNVG